MKTWIDVEPKLAFASQKASIGGREVDVFISPFNVPRAIRAEKSPDGKKLRFYFRYLDGEEAAGSTENKSDDGIVVIRYGRSSGRVAQIELDIEEAQTRAIRVNIAVAEAERALLDCERHEESLSKRLNYQAASEALELSQATLASLAGF